MAPQTNTFWTIVTLVALLITGREWIRVSELPPEPEVIPASAIAPSSQAQAFQPHMVSSPPHALNWGLVQDLMDRPSLVKTLNSPQEISIHVLVDEHGYLLRYRLHESAPDALHRCCQTYLPILKFAPAELEGRPVRCWQELRAIF